MFAGNRFSDLVSLHKSLVWMMVNGKVGEGVVDIVKQSITVASLNNLVLAKRADFDAFDLGYIGFGNFRWRRFLKEYVDSEQYWSWIRQSAQVKKNGSELVFMTKGIARKENVTYNNVNNRTYGGAFSHRWGNCLLGATFRFKPNPEIMLLSRTSALTKGGCLDLTLASIMARDLGAELGIDPSDIRFSWGCSSFQVSSWQLVPLAAAWGIKEKIVALGESTPSSKSYTRYAIGRGRNYKYASSQRAIRKGDEIEAGNLISCPVRTLVVPEVDKGISQILP